MIQALLYSIQFKQIFITLLIIKFIFYLGSKYLLSFLKWARVNFIYPNTQRTIYSLMSVKHVLFLGFYGIGSCIVNAPSLTDLGPYEYITSKCYVTVTQEIINLVGKIKFTVYTQPEGTITETITRSFDEYLTREDPTCPAIASVGTVTHTVTETVTGTSTPSALPTTSTPGGPDCKPYSVLGWLGGVLISGANQLFGGCALLFLPGTKLIVCKEITDAAVRLTGTTLVNHVSLCYQTEILIVGGTTFGLTEFGMTYLTSQLEIMDAKIDNLIGPFAGLHPDLDSPELKALISRQNNLHVQMQFVRSIGSFTLNCVANQIK